MCLKDVTVELEPLTILAGPNSSGKSALFKALGCLTRLLSYPLTGGKTGEFTLEFGTTLDELVWKGDSSFPIRFDVWLDDKDALQPDYSLQIRRDYSGWQVTREAFTHEGAFFDSSSAMLEVPLSRGQPRSWGLRPYRAPLAYLTYQLRLDPLAAPTVRPLQALRSRLGQARRYRPSASDIASFVRAKASAEGEIVVDEAGKGLAVALRDLLTTDRERFEEMERELHRLHPHVEGMAFKQDYRGVGLLYRTTRSAEALPASLESDGVLLTTFLLWRLFTAPENFQFCLEEPENGIHIQGMKERYDLLKRMAGDGSEGHPQILIATQSRDFLNAISSRSEIMDQVRVAEMNPDTGTSIRALGHYRQINQLLEEFRDQMGELWWSSRLASRT
jgi:predicted ATPase